jgi:hypothetical protein
MFLRETYHGQKSFRTGIPTCHFRFWILDFGLKEPSKLPSIQNPKSKIQNRTHGDAIVRDFHPASLSSETLSFIKEPLANRRLSPLTQAKSTSCLNQRAEL